jgi:hypothetical protein
MMSCLVRHIPVVYKMKCNDEMTLNGLVWWSLLGARNKAAGRTTCWCCLRALTEENGEMALPTLIVCDVTNNTIIL